MIGSRKSQGGRRSVVRRLFTLVNVMVLAAVIIMLGSVWTWWRYVYNNQTNVFWGMVRNNLSTSSFARTSIQDDGQQRVRQVTVTNTTVPQLLNSQSTLTQSEPATRVVTEYVGTPYDDYVRYSSIQTEQKGKDGNPLDASSIQGVWGKAGAQEPGQTTGQTYSESVLGVIPFGHLTASDREKLIQLMQTSGVYTFELTKVERKNAWSRPVYNYDVQINAQAYVTALKQFARGIGLTQLERLDPNQYKTTQPISITVKIDGWSHQLTELSYTGGLRVENLSGYGTQQQLQQIPKESISIDELQNRLQSL